MSGYGIYPKKMKTLTQKYIRTPMFIAALCTTAKTQKQPKCPSMDEWTKEKMCVCVSQWNITQP